MQEKILVVDDEPSIATLLEFNIMMAGYDVRCVHDGEAVFEILPSFRPDLIVLDWMLPKMEGLQVCKKLRKQNNVVPILMLTALQDIRDKIKGLENGADDYMTKPFSPHELIARIKAILRRAQSLPQSGAEHIYEIGRLSIDEKQRELHVDGVPVELTPKEFELLLFLCRHRGTPLSRQQLLISVWDYHFPGDTRIVDVHISHLRDKIERNSKSPEYIMTVRNVGYKLTGPQRKTLSPA